MFAGLPVLSSPCPPQAGGGWSDGVGQPVNPATAKPLRAH